MYTQSLQHKNILLSSATNEIGGAIKTVLADLGANVIVLENYDLEQLEVQLVRALEGTSTLHGFVFCCNKGELRPVKMTTISVMESLMSVNVYSFVETVRLLMKRKFLMDGSSIVAISSISSTRGLKSKTAYCASKAALDSAVRCMAMEFGKKLIRVNSIQKGVVSSDLKLQHIHDNLENGLQEDIKKQFLGLIPPGEVANVVAFLLGDMAVHITGTAIVLDGGYTI